MRSEGFQGPYLYMKYVISMIIPSSIKKQTSDLAYGCQNYRRNKYVRDRQRRLGYEWHIDYDHMNTSRAKAPDPTHSS